MGKRGSGVRLAGVRKLLLRSFRGVGASLCRASSVDHGGGATLPLFHAGRAGRADRTQAPLPPSSRHNGFRRPHDCHKEGRYAILETGRYEQLLLFRSSRAVRRFLWLGEEGRSQETRNSYSSTDPDHPHGRKKRYNPARTDCRAWHAQPPLVRFDESRSSLIDRGYPPWQPPIKVWLGFELISCRIGRFRTGKGPNCRRAIKRGVDPRDGEGLGAKHRSIHPSPESNGRRSSENRRPITRRACMEIPVSSLTFRARRAAGLARKRRWNNLLNFPSCGARARLSARPPEQQRALKASHRPAARESARSLALHVRSLTGGRSGFRVATRPFHSTLLLLPSAPSLSFKDTSLSFTLSDKAIGSIPFGARNLLCAWRESTRIHQIPPRTNNSTHQRTQTPPSSPSAPASHEATAASVSANQPPLTQHPALAC